MIYFVLPDFYHNFKLNKFLCSLNQNYTDLKYFRQPVQFTAASGTFPFSLWNGQWNCVDGAMYDGKMFTLFRDYNCFQDIPVPIRLNCSNSCLDKFMFDDEHMDAILKANHGINNYIEISNLELLNYIHEKYPKYNFIFSDNANLINEFTPEMINTLSSFNQLYRIKIPFQFAKDFDFLKELKNREKIELVVNSICSPKCPSYIGCQIAMDEAQTNYSRANPMINCYKNYHYTWNVKNTIGLDEIAEKYIPLGFKYYSFAPMPTIEIFNKLLYYFSYFLKDEDVIKMIKMFNDQEGIFQ